MSMPDSFFKKLNDAEEKIFRLWARKNWHFGMPVNELWHPVVRDEIEKIKLELAHANSN